MKALLLAAGKGTRLGSITDSVPKPLLKPRGKAVLQHLAELCARHGVTDLCINTHHLAEQIRAVMGDGSAAGLRIHYSYEEELLGTAGALHNLRSILGDDDFFVIYGDNLMDYDLGALAGQHRMHGGMATVAFYEKEDVSHSGIAVLDDEMRILQFIEKPSPEQAVSNLVNCGLYVLSPEIFDHLPDGFSDFGKDIFPALLEQGIPMYGAVMDRPLIALDTPDMLADAMGRKAAFLDRDGILNRIVMRENVVASPRSMDEFVLLPEAGELVRSLRAAGYLVVVVTNQPDVTRGHLSEQELGRMHARLQDALAPDRIDACTASDNTDRRRKPNPGMLEDAARDLRIDLSRSLMIGDSAKDVGAGRAAGVTTVLLQTGYNISAHGSADVNLDSHRDIIDYIRSL